MIKNLLLEKIQILEKMLSSRITSLNTCPHCACKLDEQNTHHESWCLWNEYNILLHQEKQEAVLENTFPASIKNEIHDISKNILSMQQQMNTLGLLVYNVANAYESVLASMGTNTIN